MIMLLVGIAIGYIFRKYVPLVYAWIKAKIDENAKP